MAKRMTDSTKWGKPFLRALQAPYKLLWIYILDECDHAGIWQVDFEVAQLKIGEVLKIETAIKSFEGKISIIDGGQKWFIKDFIEFQYGELDRSNRVHNSAIKILTRYELIDEDLKIKTLISPLQGCKDKDKDKDKDKVKDKDKDKVEKKSELIFPYDSEEFMKAWGVLIETKNWRKKEPPALQASLKKLSRVCEEDAIQMIENCIAGGWMGLVELKESEKNKKSTSKIEMILNANEFVKNLYPDEPTHNTGTNN